MKRTLIFFLLILLFLIGLTACAQASTLTALGTNSNIMQLLTHVLGKQFAGS